MCTITYIPYNSGFIVTQNRDESPLREEALFPIFNQIQNKALIYPQDPEGKGSWFVSSQEGITVGIMNAAFHPDKKEGDYRHSRGLVPLHYFDFKTPINFKNNYDFQDLEAFTLVVFTSKEVNEFNWTEKELILTTYKPQPLIFQSIPLYPSPQKEMRENWFKQFIKKHKSDSILDFHLQSQSNHPENNILMDREKVKTVSVIQRIYTTNQNELSYISIPIQKNLQVVKF